MRFTVKLGGSILEDAGVRQAILAQVSALRAGGHEIILVHGGGKRLNRRLTQLGLPSQFAGGLRITDAATLGAALMVLAGEVNKGLVAELGKAGARAVGICGLDAQCVRCVRISALSGHPKGIGFVGKPVSLDRDFFDLILGAGLIPVVASIAVGEDWQPHNVNADQMASICAWGNACRALVYLTDVAGVQDEHGSVFPSLRDDDIEKLRSRGIVSGGMLPKTQSCVEALEHCVPSIYILPGTSPDILLKFIDGTLTEGTCIHGNN